MNAKAAWLGLLLAVAGSLLPSAGQAQALAVDLGAGGSATGQIVRLVGLITVLSLAPSILVMVTSFTRIVIVLSFLRTALGLQQTPSNSRPEGSWPGRPRPESLYRLRHLRSQPSLVVRYGSWQAPLRRGNERGMSGRRWQYSPTAG